MASFATLAAMSEATGAAVVDATHLKAIKEWPAKGVSVVTGGREAA